MRRAAAALFAATLAIGSLASAARAATPDGTKTELMAADRAFATRARTAGFAQGMRETMDSRDGLQFDAGADPVRGAEAIYTHMKPYDGAGQISWEPAEAFAAQGGDMGVTWGHWRIQPATAGKKPITGRYVTVWRKDAAGAWKGLVDIGNPD